MKHGHTLALCLALSACMVPAVGAAAVGPNNTHLQAYVWHLAEATDPQGRRIDALFVKDTPPPALSFAHGYISVQNLCNATSARYHLEGGRLIIGDGMQTLVGCTGAVAAQEEQANALIFTAAEPTLTLSEDGAMTWLGQRGDRLVFTPQPTPETRYGSAGQTLHLEVASRTVPCAPPSPPTSQCLQVREVQGMTDRELASAGAFTTVPWQIEGFTHEDGMRSVLLVKRFATRTDGTAPTWAYVFQGAYRTTNERAGQ